MSNQNINQLHQQYDDCIAKVNNLTNLIKQLSGEHELESLEEVVVPQEYLELLANSLYSLNSLTYAYCNLKAIDFPPEFAKVKQYFRKAKEPLAVQNPQPASSSQPSNPVVINKEAVKRVIQRSIK